MAKRADRSVAPALDQYSDWLRRKFRRVPGVQEGQSYYETATVSLKYDLERTAFWRSLQDSLPNYEAAYFVNTGVGLLAMPHSGEVSIKPWTSFVEKTYRRNVLLNESFPDPPDGGWLLPPNWFWRIKDILRTTYVVKYLDGVHDLGRRIEDHAGDNALSTESSLEGTRAGYYAGHVVVMIPLQRPTVGWGRETLAIPVEFQITTQVKEVIKELLHKNYARDRMQGLDEDLTWQWEYDGRPFASNYLGHILHYVEGRIMNIRNMDAEASDD
jgi:hypothetical protein